MAFTVPNRMWHNPAIGAAVNSVSNAFFGKTDKTGLDPSAIWENEQQALAAKALAAQREAQTNLYNQQHSAIADFMKSPDFHHTGLNSNFDQWTQGQRTKAGTSYLADIMTNPDATDEAKAQALYSGYMGETMPKGGFHFGTRENQFTRDQQRQIDENAATIAGRSADNSADNVRALQEAELTNESNVLQKILAPVQAGAQRFNPPGVVEKYGVDAIQATPAKPSTSSTATVVPWTAYDDSEVSRIVTKEVERLPKVISGLDNIDQVPGGMWQAVGRKIQLKKSVTDKSVSGGRFFKNPSMATKAFMQKMMAKGLTEIDVSLLPWGEFYMPTALVDNWMDAFKKKESTKEQILDDLTNTVDGWGIDPEKANAVVEWIVENSG